MNISKTHCMRLLMVSLCSLTCFSYAQTNDQSKDTASEQALSQEDATQPEETLESSTKPWRGFSITPAQFASSDVDDDDQDGVANFRDTCLASLKGTDVGDDGCKKEFSQIETIKLKINFSSNSAVVAKKYYPTIQKLAQKFKKSGASKLLIEGHTDNVGGEAYNEKLSKNRAQSVAQVLVKRYKIKLESLLISGRGESDPVTSNKSAAGRAQNRRMIAYFTYEDRMRKKQWNIWSVNLDGNNGLYQEKEFEIPVVDDK